jgi:hypothetical protein
MTSYIYPVSIMAKKQMPLYREYTRFNRSLQPLFARGSAWADIHLSSPMKKPGGRQCRPPGLVGKVSRNDANVLQMVQRNHNAV